MNRIVCKKIRYAHKNLVSSISGTDITMIDGETLQEFDANSQVGFDEKPKTVNGNVFYEQVISFSSKSVDKSYLNRCKPVLLILVIETDTQTIILGSLDNPVELDLKINNGLYNLTLPHSSEESQF